MSPRQKLEIIRIIRLVQEGGSAIGQTCQGTGETYHEMLERVVRMLSAKSKRGAQ